MQTPSRRFWRPLPINGAERAGEAALNFRTPFDEATRFPAHLTLTLCVTELTIRSNAVKCIDAGATHRGKGRRCGQADARGLAEGP